MIADTSVEMADSTTTQTDADGLSAKTGEETSSQGGHKGVEDIMSKPIPGPNQAGPAYLLEPDMKRPVSTSLYILRLVMKTIQIPTTWIRENVVVPNKGPKYYYYHRKYPRALPIDECYADDFACVYEADLEFHRIRKVDRATLKLLKYRRDNCWFWHSTNEAYYKTADACKDINETYEREETNYHIKYGDTNYRYGVLQAFNRQKHRMIVERRKAEMAQEPEAKPE